MNREQEKRALNSMATWSIFAVIALIMVVGRSGPMWARVLLGVFAFVAAFFAGLVTPS